ncbi:transcript variant X3 [Nothobranchius furzeri]|uniref:Transcript variant X2 n=1 Tax=Nothobranchius furzeri TaxID=105023 RepID=A0A9D3BYT4_NOTFU|nr:transcript variant X2 [Nothobranchius furzeri]KAF7225071.1 transcript variant X3 [Nothobranchius furzeri]
MPFQLRVIVAEHDIRKLKLQSGVPDTVEGLMSVILEEFQLHGEFGLLYEDKDFGNEYFSVISTADLEDMATVKLVRKEPVFTLDFVPLNESGLPHTTTSGDMSAASEREMHTSAAEENEDSALAEDDGGSSSSNNTIILPASFRTAPWPARFKVPTFSRDIEMILAEANMIHQTSGRHFNDASIKSAVMQDLAKAIFSYTAYPSNVQIISVVEALVEKFPCLKEPGSFSGMYGWQQRLKYKMHNYRTMLKSRKFAYPELEVNMLKKKKPVNTTPAKNVRKPKKAEVNYLPPHPSGESEETLERERLELVEETKKRNNAKLIAEKMAKTFSLRRMEIVTECPAVHVVKERWPGLFTEAQIKEEFKRLTAVPLEETFLQNLDGYTQRLLQLMRTKGGAAGTRMRPFLNSCEAQTVQKRRDSVICCLIDYLGEPKKELFQDLQGNHEDFSNQTLKVLVFHIPTAEEAAVAIMLEGNQVLTGCGTRTRGCIFLMGLIYALNLEYPKKLKCTFEVFQKLFLCLDCAKLSHKVQNLKAKLME